ncbi:MAG TPA: EamA family transporter [Candidatus Methylomirabilis sp.]
MNSLRRRLLGAVCLFVAAAIWGGMYVVSKYVLDYIPPMTLLAVRLVIGGGALLLVMAASRTPRVGVRDLPRMALLGLVGFGISLAAQFIGTRLSSASHGAVITSVTPAFILVFAATLLKERITWAKIAAVGIATAGVLLVVEQPEGFRLEARAFWGDLLLLVAGITWALYTVLGRLAANRYPPVTVTTYATLTGILWVLPAIPVELRGITWQPLPAAVWWGTLYLGVVSTAVAFYLWNKGFTLMDAATGSLFFFAQPVVGAALGWLLLGERLSARFLLGTAVIIAGGVLATRQST